MTDKPANNLLFLLEVLAKRSRFIITFVFVMSVLAIIVSLVLPKWYKATATLLPPKQITVPVGGLSKFSEVVSVTSGLDLPVMVTPSDVYARMLKSRTISEAIIKQFDLFKRYDKDNFDETYEMLMNNSDFRVTSEGLLTVSVEDREPNAAADMANAFVDELDRINRQIASQRARHNRDFIEQRLDEVKAELDSARSRFEQFQKKNKAIDFDQQTKLLTERAVALKVIQAETDLELQLASQEMELDNPTVVELRRKKKVITDQIEKLEYENSDSSYFSVPMSKIPELRGQYEMLLTQVRVNEAVYKLLLEQREQAKIQVTENSPTISILDPARPPSLRSRPKRTIIVISTFAISLIIAVFISGTAEYLGRIKTNSPEQYRAVDMFLTSYFGWLPGMKKKN